MNAPLTIIRNREKLPRINLNKMKSALNFSKKDTDLYFFILSVIAEKHLEIKKRSEAFKFLLKQTKLQNVLNDLINRHNILTSKCNEGIYGNIDRQEIIRQINQLTTELSIFSEMHFRIKRGYLRFTNEHFQAGWRQSYMVA